MMAHDGAGGVGVQSKDDNDNSIVKNNHALPFGQNEVRPITAFSSLLCLLFSQKRKTYSSEILNRL